MKHILTTLTLLLLISLVYTEIPSFGYHVRSGIKTAEILKVTEENTARIVGGTQTGLAEFGFQAGILITLTTGWTSVCGGTLISRERILTAAHCWWDGQSQARHFTVVLGSLTLWSGGTRDTTSDVAMHPFWDPEGFMYDVAMARIAAVEYSNNIYAVPLPDVTDANQDFANLLGTASGYGKVSDATNLIPSTATLYHVNVEVLPNVVCQQSFPYIHGSHICTSGDGGRGTCDGDSGGPLTVLWNNRRTLIGIATFRFTPACQQGHPSVYSRVTAFLPWILANM